MMPSWAEIRNNQGVTIFAIHPFADGSSDSHGIISSGRCQLPDMNQQVIELNRFVKIHRAERSGLEFYWLEP
jgi:hypothetical protein